MMRLLLLLTVCLGATLGSCPANSHPPTAQDCQTSSGSCVIVSGSGGCVINQDPSICVCDTGYFSGSSCQVSGHDITVAGQPCAVTPNYSCYDNQQFTLDTTSTYAYSPITDNQFPGTLTGTVGTTNSDSFTIQFGSAMATDTQDNHACLSPESASGGNNFYLSTVYKDDCPLLLLGPKRIFFILTCTNLIEDCSLFMQNVCFTWTVPPPTPASPTPTPAPSTRHQPPCPLERHPRRRPPPVVPPLPLPTRDTASSSQFGSLRRLGAARCSSPSSLQPQFITLDSQTRSWAARSPATAPCVTSL